MFNGLWVLEFISTINRYGRGVIVINNDRLLGGDDGYYYSGKCSINGNNINAAINIIRYDDTSISVFGNVDHFELNLEGNTDGVRLNATGTIAGSHEFKIKVTGIKKEDMQS
jgi:hypothetical protein